MRYFSILFLIFFITVPSSLKADEKPKTIEELKQKLKKKEKKPPLNKAVSEGNIKLIKELIEKGADITLKVWS